MKKQITYKKLSNAIITSKKNLVISSYSNGGYTIAQQICISDGDQEISVFLKGGIHIDSLEGLYNLRDALNLAIKKIEK